MTGPCPPRRAGRRVLVLASCALVLGLAACGAGQDAATEPGAGETGNPTSAAGDQSTPSTTTPSTTTPSTDSPSPTAEPRALTLVATGDVLLHERLWYEARRDAGPGGTWNFAPQLAAIRPVVEGADVAVCHLETPLAPSAADATGYPLFAAPPEIVPALAGTGYDACTTASNHTFDQGTDGVDRTLDALDAAGLAHAGSARTRAEADAPTLIEVETRNGPVTLGLVSFTYGFNGIAYPNGETWRSNEIDQTAILADAAAARSAGAEIVVVALHWGTEYDQRPDARQLDLAPALIGSPDIDLLLGHHAHVVQPVENIGGEWVVYGMGNLMANHAEPQGAKSEGLLTRFTFTEDPVTGEFTATTAEYLPLYQTYQPPVEVLDVPAALSSGAVGTAGADRLEEALLRTTAVVESRGGAAAGLVPLAHP